MGQLEELEVPTSGGTAEQSKQLKQLVDKWCCENEPIITSLRKLSSQEVQEQRDWSML